MSEPDDGIFYAMNKAIKLADSNLMIFLNSGDIFLPNTLNNNIATEGLFPVWYENRFGKTIRRKIKNKIFGMPYTHQGYLLDMKNKQFSDKYKYAADYNHILHFRIELNKFFLGGVYFDSTGVSTKKIMPKIEVMKIQFKYFSYFSIPFVIFNIVKLFIILFFKVTKIAK